MRVFFSLFSEMPMVADLEAAPGPGAWPLLLIVTLDESCVAFQQTQ